MNLTYSDDIYSERVSVSNPAAAHMRVIQTIASGKNAGLGFAFLAPLVAAGAQAAASALTHKGGGMNAELQRLQALVKDYQNMAGTVPGRVLGVAKLKDVLASWLPFGAWPPISQDTEKTPASRTFWENAQEAARRGLARGATSAEDIYNREWPQVYGANPLQAWMKGRGDPGQKELTIDFIDAAMAQFNPSIPPSYGTQAAPAPAALPVNIAPANVPVQVSQQPILTASAPAPISAPSFAAPSFAAPQDQTRAAALQQAGIDPMVSNQISQLLTAMQSQGASQAQMMNASLQALAARGVNTSVPAVQQAVKSASGAGGIGQYLPWIAGGVGLIGLIFVLTRKRGRA